MCELTRN